MKKWIYMNDYYRYMFLSFILDTCAGNRQTKFRSHNETCILSWLGNHKTVERIQSRIPSASRGNDIGEATNGEFGEIQIKK